MPFDAGTTTVASAGTRKQITADLAAGSTVRADTRLLAIQVTARGDNTGAAVYFGRSNVSSNYGRRIAKGDSVAFAFEPASEKFSNLYVDADNDGDEIDWEVIWVA